MTIKVHNAFVLAFVICLVMVRVSFGIHLLLVYLFAHFVAACMFLRAGCCFALSARYLLLCAIMVANLFLCFVFVIHFFNAE